MSLLAVALALVGSGSTSGNGDAAEPAQPAGAVTAAPEPTDEAAAATTRTPSETRGADPMETEGSHEVTREEWLEELWAGPGPHPPFPEFIREVDTDEFPDVMGACLKDSGFEAGSDGYSYWVDHTEEQTEALREATWVCLGKYPLKASYYQPFTDEQLAELWHYQTTDLVACIEARGYPVPQPPSMETFIAQWRAGGQRWHPATDVPGEQSFSVSGACPDFPEGFYD